MFVMMQHFVAIIADASIRIGGVMVMTIVEMIPTRKIVMVRIFFLFPFFVMFIIIMFKSNM